MEQSVTNNSNQKRKNKPTSASLRADPLPNSLWSLAGTRKWTKKLQVIKKKMHFWRHQALLGEFQFCSLQGLNKEHKHLRLPVILSNRDFPVEGLGLVTCRVKTTTLKSDRMKITLLGDYNSEIFFNTNISLKVMQSFQNSFRSLHKWHLLRFISLKTRLQITANINDEWIIRMGSGSLAQLLRISSPGVKEYFFETLKTN